MNKINSFDDLRPVIGGLNKISTEVKYKFGVAGSFARGDQTNKSDVDVIISGGYMLSVDDYNRIVKYLSENLEAKFDVLNLEALEEEDKELDSMLTDMGLEINDRSAYKNIKREVIWIE